MPQIFYPSTNTISRVSIAAAVLALTAFALVGGALQRSPYLTEVGVPREQPIPFSHKHHVAGLGIDCRYCHTSVEESSFAGIPPTETCMNCHREIWKDSPMLEAVRESYRSGRPLEWIRVHDASRAGAWMDPLRRREFLKLMAASLALGGLTACTSQPPEKIVPYVKAPEDIVPGKPLFFATAVAQGGFGTGVLVESHMGRPTKVEGNPEHPASLGATDAAAQAWVLTL